MNRAHPFSLAALAALALAAGCASKTPPPPKDALASGPGVARPASEALAEVRPDTKSPSSGSVHIEDRIVKACGDLPTAHFAFDSASVESGAAAALDALGRCFTTGPLRGKGMKLVGHADPRGESEYNLGLGQRRAGSVEAYLAKTGVEASHMATSSRGELDATGTDEQGWARDRKVDVLLSE